MWPCVVGGLSWLYKDSELGAQTRGPWDLRWIKRATMCRTAPTPEGRHLEVAGNQQTDANEVRVCHWLADNGVDLQGSKAHVQRSKAHGPIFLV